MAGVGIDTLTMEQYLALSQENQAPDMFKPEIRAAKRWVDRLALGTINTWDLLKKAFIQRYCPPSMTAKQLEDIITSSKKETNHYTRPRSGPRPTEALTSIQSMADHSQKWHDGITSRNIRSSSSKDGIAALVNKLDNLGRDMKKLKESVHAIQVGCQICEGPHLDKDCPLNKEAKQVEEIVNRPPYGEKRQSLEELLAKHQEESARRSNEMEAWIKKLHENAEINTRNQSASLKNLETQIEQLTKEIHSDKTLDSSSEQIKTITVDQETYGLNKLHGVSFTSDPESDATEVLQHQLPRKELNPGNFTPPCTISKFNFYAMTDLGASINVMPRSIYKHLHLTNLRKTNMLCEMADMSKTAPLGIVENVLVKIGKFLFLSDFIIIDNTPSETTILGRPFLATIRAEIDVFAIKIFLEINEDRISFYLMRNSHKYTNPSERISMVRPQSPAQSNNQIDYEESGNWDNRSPNLDEREPKKQKIELDKNVPKAHFCSPIK
ncbi:reverse transcriptase domain-containing protein [Tanacetum coccineum]